MVEADLSKELIDAGAQLIKKLDESNLAPDAAFWLYSPEKQMWKLLLVEAKLAKKGPREVYSEIQKIMTKYGKELGDLKLSDLVLERPDARIVELIRKALRTGSKVNGIRFKNNMIDGALIDDAYIYRIA